METKELDGTFLSKKIKEIAFKIGFSHVGIAAVQLLEPEKKHLEEWLGSGKHGKMKYMENYFDKRVDPEILCPGAKSIISVAMNYYTPQQHTEATNKGKISRYAWGDDYHDVLKKKLKLFLEEIKKLDISIEGRAFVDSAPVMDKAWAVRSGIGWQGKHSNVITRSHGSWVFLGELIINKVLVYDTPMEDYCGSCTRCIDACPTDAISPYVVDATKCISYVTIELKPEHDIPTELQNKMDNWIFGCDICQDVCPWNTKFSQVTEEESFQPRPHNISPDLQIFSELEETSFQKLFRKSPIKRTKLQGLLRNIKAVLANLKRD